MEVILGTSKQELVGLKYLVAGQRSGGRRGKGKSTYTLASAHLSNTTAKRRGIAEQLLSQLRENTERNDADTIVGGDFNTSTYRERGKAKVSSIKDAWEETLLTPPPDFVPMWGQIEDSGDCCGFIPTIKNVANCRVAKHGSLQLGKEKMHFREADQGARLSVFIHHCETHAAERSARGEADTQYRKQRGEKRRREKRIKKRHPRAP